MDAETQEIRQARQRASVKWLLSKAFNNRVPDNLKEPFYRDHENQDRLKPQIIVELGNATLYCQTLSNLYSDPNYQSLNHTSILQTLSRKGVPVADGPDQPLTETVLIQTNPLKINAHMSVIESLMTLYAREISSGNRIQDAMRRISEGRYVATQDQPIEHQLLSWISHACAALKKRIERELETGKPDGSEAQLQSPNIPPIRDFQDLCDGICLALLISYYCPKVVRWTAVRINYLPAVEDSIHNISIVNSFSQKHLPYNVFHMTPEDVTYMRGSMKLNLLLLLADLFNLFEIHPAQCVCYPDMDSQESIAERNAGANTHGIVHRRGPTKQQVKPIPDLRSELDPSADSLANRPPFQATPAFVVHKSRGITTLSSVHVQQQQQQEPLVPARLRQSKEKSNVETKADERGDYVPAGRPSNWEQNRRPSYAGRRSRRNSSSEDSQLTIENFGGSQDHLNAIDRYDRERDRERERKVSSTMAEPAMAVRSSIADARGTLQLGYDTDSGSEKQDRETEKYSIRQQPSMDNVAKLASNTAVHPTVLKMGSPIPLQKQQHSNDKDYGGSNVTDAKANPYDYEATLTRKPSYSGVPLKNSNWQNSTPDSCDDDIRSMENASKLSNMRIKLEERHRRIEEEKRRIELALLRHQDRLPHDDHASSPDILKWETLSNDSKHSPDIDPDDMEKYQQSIAVMNMNLQDIQQDIQKLASQQTQIQAQQVQAQQLMKVQHIANMLNKHQNYGSQQHIADSIANYQMRSMQQQPNFGSTPHLAQSFNPNVNVYSSRPPSRDSFQPMQAQPPPPTQYINEHGQYMSPQQQMPHSHYMRAQNIYNDSPVQYSNLGYGNAPYTPPHPQSQQQYMNPVGYDDYPHYQGHDHNSPQANRMYMHETSPQPPPIQRRTWSQSASEQQQPMVDINAWQSQKRASVIDGNYGGWGRQSSYNANNQPLGGYHQNGGGDFQNFVQTQHANAQHMDRNSDGVLHQQHSVLNLHDTRSPNSKMSKASPKPPPPDDIMAPQSICFIGDEEDVEELERNIIESMQVAHIGDYSHQKHQMHNERGSSSEDYENNEMIAQKLNITSGNLTYRIPSPSRPSLHADSFQDPRGESVAEKGFYISFDDEQPKRPKPPLRAKRSPKKEKSFSNIENQHVPKRESVSSLHNSANANTAGHNGKSDPSSHNSSRANNNTEHNQSYEHNNATYNKYTDAPIQLRQVVSPEMSNNHAAPVDRRRLEDVTNQQQQMSHKESHNQYSHVVPRQHMEQSESQHKPLIIGNDAQTIDPESAEEMERRKEKIMLLSLQRRQQQEEARARKEIESSQRREQERQKEEERARKKEDQMARRAAILEQHRLKKAIEEAEREGKTLDRTDFIKPQAQSASVPRLRSQRVIRPRPKTIHVDDASVDISEASSISSRGKKGSSTNLTGYSQLSSNSMRRDFYRGSQDSLNVKESPDEYPSTSSTPIGRRGSYKTSRDSHGERGRTLSRISVAKGSSLNFGGRKSNSLMNLCDSGLGRATPPRRAPSPGMGPSGRHMPSPSGPGSLPPGLISKRRGFDDGSSDISSTPNLMMEYSGPKLYKQPTAKSNRGIILNAVEYCVFPGAVNRDAKQKVLEKIARSEAKHFLVLFRDAGCQFRALYSYVPETDQVSKLYGTGPSQVDEVMFDKFFKYNSGGKCFSQVHTKHLTVTIDAFTIHNSLWQGKKVHLPSKKDMALVI